MTQALLNPKVLALSGVYFGMVATLYGLGFFLPQIVREFVASTSGLDSYPACHMSSGRSVSSCGGGDRIASWNVDSTWRSRCWSAACIRPQPSR